MSVILATSASFSGGGNNQIINNIVANNAPLNVPAYGVQKLAHPGITVNLDQLSINEWDAAKWYVVLSTSTKIQSYEIFADHQFGINPQLTVYDLTGDVINIIPSVIISSNNLILQFDNTETEDVLIYATRIAIPAASVSVIPNTNIEIMPTQVTVAIGNTQLIDSVSRRTTKAVKWLISVSDPTNKKTGLQILTVVKQDDSINTSNYATIGTDSSSFLFSVSATSTEIQLNMTNVDMLYLHVDVVRIPIQPQRLPILSGESITYSPITTLVPIGQTTTIDNIPIPGCSGAKWLINIKQLSTGKSGSFEVVGYYDMLGEYCVRYAGISTDFDILVDVVVVDIELELLIANNDSADLSINLVRIPMII